MSLLTPPSSPLAPRRFSISERQPTPRHQRSPSVYIPPARRSSLATPDETSVTPPLSPASPKRPSSNRASWPDSPSIIYRPGPQREREPEWRERQGRSLGPCGSASLAVFGESFLGPLKLIQDEEATETHKQFWDGSFLIRKWKGASAKGLNNAESQLGVGPELLDELEEFMAYEPASYSSNTYVTPLRHALLIFGNVDLQTNYLYNLLTRSLSSPDSPPDTPPSPYTNLSATPLKFLTSRVNHYISFLTTVIDSPIGQRLCSDHNNPNIPLNRKPKILVSGAIIPFVEDDQLEAVVRKYIVRFNDDDNDRRDHDPSTATNSRTCGFSAKGKNVDSMGIKECKVDSSLGLVTPPRPSTPLSASPSSTLEKLEENNIESKFITSVPELLAHSPPLITYDVRLAMTLEWNRQLSAFCALHPKVLRYVDINNRMMDGERNVNRDFAAPIDDTNIHPSWERTLPLWLEILEENHMDTSELDLGHLEREKEKYTVGKLEQLKRLEW